jgi:hypothetical protein
MGIAIAAKCNPWRAAALLIEGNIFEGPRTKAVAKGIPQGSQVTPHDVRYPGLIDNNVGQGARGYDAKASPACEPVNGVPHPG